MTIQVYLPVKQPEVHGVFQVKCASGKIRVGSTRKSIVCCRDK